ncbi:DUF3667 domain-containing protein [Dyella sp.]|jgi:hypothetical protein|uniref:DUF3667 domain-containing protein n=1 Tax=Dyella sp. TaxID=1869338 RepID=UPI002D7A328D|nr:DUF3667 domain-containing protein [Dyella sp.]HET6431901.1 DUF3667 domain-containing protein [Dyella sp.]
MNELDHLSQVSCANCGTAMQGEFCHHCGQSIHSVLKPVHHMVEDTMDMVLHVDGRIVHTLPPLLVKPGFLTLEYFSGRRMRYIAPFRLMFVLALLAFFVCHLALDGDDVPRDAVVLSTPFDQAGSAQEVQQLLDRRVAAIGAQRQKAGSNAVALAALGAQEARVRTEAADRLAELAHEGKQATASTGTTHSHVNLVRADGATSFFSGEWDAKAHPVQIGWLPGFVNRRLTAALEHMHANVAALADDGEASLATRERLVGQLFSSLPQVLFLMLPLFALLLKVLYVFRRRLYMEHLIVALHSHAFLFLALLLAVLLALLEGWLATIATCAAGPVHLLEWALAIWVPIYLLLMQKRIYRQGWPMTIVKYLVVGWCYLWLLTFALVLSAALTLSH